MSSQWESVTPEKKAKNADGKIIILVDGQWYPGARKGDEYMALLSHPMGGEQSAPQEPEQETSWLDTAGDVGMGALKGLATAATNPVSLTGLAALPYSYVPQIGRGFKGLRRFLQPEGRGESVAHTAVQVAPAMIGGGAIAKDSIRALATVAKVAYQQGGKAGVREAVPVAAKSLVGGTASAGIGLIPGLGSGSMGRDFAIGATAGAGMGGTAGPFWQTSRKIALKQWLARKLTGQGAPKKAAQEAAEVLTDQAARRAGSGVTPAPTAAPQVRISTTPPVPVASAAAPKAPVAAVSQEAPVAAGHVRLYRGETPETFGGKWFSRNRAQAEVLAQEPGGRMVSVDVPISQVKQLKISGEHYLVPKKVPRTMQHWKKKPEVYQGGTATGEAGLEDLLRASIKRPPKRPTKPRGPTPLEQIQKLEKRAKKRPVAKAPIPPVATGMVRLYRGVPAGRKQAVKGSYGRSFVTTEAAARQYAGPKGQIHYVDVPEGVFSDSSIMGKFTMRAADSTEIAPFEVFAPASVAAKTRPIM